MNASSARLILGTSLLALVAACQPEPEKQPQPESSTPSTNAPSAQIQSNTPENMAESDNSNRPDPYAKPTFDWKTVTDEEWRNRLDKAAYRITRQKGTERAFTGDYWDNKEAGTYVCVCCDLPLFSSDHKFKSGTGWPSYWQPIEASSTSEKEDRSLWAVRTETLCSRCDAHLGHVFPDGPEPTGLRYCINSAALKFVPKEKTDAEQPEVE